MTLIRATTPADVSLLPAIETSAGQAFRAYTEFAWVADDKPMSIEEHNRFVATETSWVAIGDVGLIGFICAELVGQELHIWELAVHAEAQRAGVGRQLMQHAIAFAVADPHCLRQKQRMGCRSKVGAPCAVLFNERL